MHAWAGFFVFFPSFFFFREFSQDIKTLQWCSFHHLSRSFLSLSSRHLNLTTGGNFCRQSWQRDAPCLAQTWPAVAARLLWCSQIRELNIADIIQLSPGNNNASTSILKKQIKKYIEGEVALGGARYLFTLQFCGISTSCCQQRS